MIDLIEYEQEFAEKLFYTPDELDKSGGVWPLRAGRNIAKSNYVSGPKFVECYSFHFILDGQLLFQQNTSSVELKKGDLFVMLPGISYTYRVIPSNHPLRMVWFAVDGPHLHAMLGEQPFQPNLPYTRQVVNVAVERTLNELLQQFRNIDRSNSYLLFIGTFYLLLGQLTSNIRSDMNQKQFSWVQKSIDFMHEHFMQSINIRDVAKSVGIERSHFSTVFTEQVGTSPSKYLKKLKMEKAAEMLKETNYSITEIALSVGYSDLFPFTRAFTQYYGASPSEYRK